MRRKINSTERTRKWYQNNPEKAKEHQQKRYSNKSHEITEMEWEECKKYFNHRCAYCGLAIEEHYIKFRGKEILGDFHKEHFIHDGANDLSNCVPSCKFCNLSKNEWEFEKWYKDSGYYSEEKERKIYKWLNEDYKKYIKINNT